MNLNNNKMRISLIGPSYPFRGGISHYTTLLYRNLRIRHCVNFFSFKRQYPKFFFPGKTDIDPSQIHFKEGDTKRIIDSMNPLSWMKVAWKIINSNQHLLIIPWWVSFWAPQFWTITFFVKKFSKTKVLFLCHNVVEHESKWYDKLLTRVVLRQGDYFIVHSNEDRSNLLKMLPKATVSKAFHPTYDCFNFSNHNPHEIRKQYNLKDNVLLFFGFVREYKGLKYLLEAIPAVLSQIQTNLLVIGKFWDDKEDYLKLVEKLKIGAHVIFIDKYVPDEEVGKYFSASDLVVQPYVSATGSGIIQIAFGFHKPVVTTRVGALPEVVNDGKTGYLLSPGSSEEIAEAIVNFFQHKKAEAFKRNSRNENYRFFWYRIIDVIESLVTSSKYNTNPQ